MNQIYKNTYLMLLALLISLPIIKYLGVKPFIFPDTLPLTYFPLLCYLVSFLMMVNLKNLEKK